MPYAVSGVLGLKVFEKDEDGLALKATYTTAPESTASVYAIGCVVTDLSSGIAYTNVGTVAVPVWQAGGESGSASETVATTGAGTTAVSVFGASGLPYAITITGIYLISADTTAGNVTVEAPASTVVATIAKGTAAGALVGATSLANTSVPAATNVIIDCSSAGVAQVFITYKRA